MTSAGLIPWPDASATACPPRSCPFAYSTDLVGLDYNFNGSVNVPLSNVDTWYPSWSSSGSLYSTWTDGYPNPTKPEEAASSCGPCESFGGIHHPPNNGSNVSQGFAQAVGNSPQQLRISSVGKYVGSSALPYQGRYPSGSLFYRGVWYVGTYALSELWGSAQWPCGNWCVMGPFVGFRHSSDGGHSWHEPRQQMASDFKTYSATDTFFGEMGPVCMGRINNTAPHKTDPCTIPWKGHRCSPYTCIGRWSDAKIKFGAPHIVDLGRELEHAPGGEPRVYMVGHGAQLAHQPHSWMQGSAVYLCRTTAEPSPSVMSDGAMWEFFAGRDAIGNVRWSADVDDASPLFSWENRTGAVTMTYAPSLRKFLMVVGTPTCAAVECDGVGAMAGTFDTYILEADSITGPFRLVTYMAKFGPQAYFANLPSKFLEADGETGGLIASLSYSANYSPGHTPNPAGSGYHWSLLRVRLRGKHSVTPRSEPLGEPVAAAMAAAVVDTTHAPTEIEDELDHSGRRPRRLDQNEWQAGTSSSEVGSLRSELSRATRALSRVAEILPRLESCPRAHARLLAAKMGPMAGYPGIAYVGSSSDATKSVTIQAWGTSAIPVRVRNVTLLDPVDKFSIQVSRETVDSFALSVTRTNPPSKKQCQTCSQGWGQKLWANYYVDGVFSSIDHAFFSASHDTAAAPTMGPKSSAEPRYDAEVAQSQLTNVVRRFFARPASDVSVQPTVSPSPKPIGTPAVLPLLRHLGGEFAEVESLWQRLISAHPEPSRATVIEVGVADGLQSRYAAEYGVRVIGVEPNKDWLTPPKGAMTVARAKALPNLELVHAAASSRDGKALFGGSGTGGSLIGPGGSAGGKAGGKRGGKGVAAKLEARAAAGGKRFGGGGAKRQGAGGGNTASRGTMVPTRRLDTLVAERNLTHVYVVKIDVRPPMPSS